MVKTDLEKFIELYASLGIKLEPVAIAGEWDSENYIKTQPEAAYKLNLYVDEHKGFIGYGGFYSDILFDAEGKFLKQCFWGELLTKCKSY